MSAQLIFDHVPLGAIIRYSDGTPRPPERHRRKLRAWESRNNTGRFVRKQAGTRVGETTIPAAITLHEGDFGSKAVIVLRAFKTFSVDSTRKRSPGHPVVEQWIGISRDEIMRVKPSRETWQVNRWPLIEMRMSRQDCLAWLRRHDFQRMPEADSIEAG